MSDETSAPLAPAVPLLRKDVKKPARVVNNETIYHQAAGQQPTSSTSRYAVQLSSDEQPFVRIGFRVGPEWKPLETGWLSAASMLSLSVDDADGPDVAVAIGIQVGVIDSAFSLLKPGQSCRFSPVQLSALRVRSFFGNARCTLRLYPE